MKYILEIKPEYEDSFKGVMILGAKDSNLFVDTLAVENLEELNSDYINEHYGSLQDDAYNKGYAQCQDDYGDALKHAKDTAYQKGFEDGKAVNDKGCEGCKYAEMGSDNTICAQCCIAYYNQWTAKQTDNCIEIGDEVEWDGDKYIVTYRNIDINTGVIQDYDLMMWDGSVVDHVKKCSFVKTGNHYDISSILKEMQS